MSTEGTLLQSALADLDDSPPLTISRKLKDRYDQGIELVERALLGKFTDELKQQLLECAKSESTGRMDRALGAMLGLVIGDWVGAPLEFLQAVDEPAASRWNHDSFQVENPNTNEKERGVLQAGQWTDDTSMSLCIADSLIACRGFNGSDIRLRFWSWHADGYNNTFRFDTDRTTVMLPGKDPRSSFGLGYNIAKSLMAIEPDSEISPQFINPGSNDSGNGGLMRLAPVPIFFATRSPQEVMDVAALSSLTTHPGDLATETAKCLAWLEHRAINSTAAARKDGARAFLIAACDEYADMLSKRVTSTENGGGSTDTTAGLQELRSLLLSTKAEDSTESCWNWRSPASSFSVLRALKARGEKYNGHPVSRPYFGSYCMDALAIALHSVAVTSTFHHAIERAVNFLGDADTVGAIAGQIAGAFYGYASIDPRYTAPIQRWDHDEIACRAILCFLLGCNSNEVEAIVSEPKLEPPPENATEMKVTTKKSSSFYAKSACNFLRGVDAKPAKEGIDAIAAKPAVEHLRISGLGEAVGVAVAAAAQVEASGLGSTIRIQTAYPSMDASRRGCAQILIDLKKCSGDS